MRSFFNRTSSDSLDTITKLKGDMVKAREAQASAESHASEVDRENKKLTEPHAMVSPPFLACH